LVEQLRSKADRLAAMTELIGAVNARDLRSVQLSEAAFTALVDGLSHSNPQVRWWSVQLLDHCPDPRSVDAIAPLLDDCVPRVRRNAAHALGCLVCKPSWSGTLTESVIERLSAMAQSDPNAKVRAEATAALRIHWVGGGRSPRMGPSSFV
jgi:HEAT repeat protein